MQDLGQLIIVHLVEKRPTGDVFPRKRADWPLHITLVPWFSMTTENQLQVLDALHGYGQRTMPFVVYIGLEESFGPGKDVPVNVIRDQAPMLQLHNDLSAIVKKHGGTWQGTASASSGIDEMYRAHITHHVTNDGIHRRFPGDEERVNDFTVARLLEDKGMQFVEILQTISLGSDYETAT